VRNRAPTSSATDVSRGTIPDPLLDIHSAAAPPSSWRMEAYVRGRVDGQREES